MEKRLLWPAKYGVFFAAGWRKQNYSVQNQTNQNKLANREKQAVLDFRFAPSGRSLRLFNYRFAERKPYAARPLTLYLI
jgi:hypothetical protein